MKLICIAATAALLISATQATQCADCGCDYDVKPNNYVDG